MLSDYQEQLLMHPAVSFVRSGTVAGAGDGTYSTFVVKDVWTHFALRDDYFAEISSGRPLPVLSGADAALPWIWPWDIVNFLLNIPTGFLSVMTRSPGLVLEGWTIANDRGLANNRAALQELAHGTIDNWREFFRRLGTNEEFKAFYPQHAQCCRAIAGMEPPPSEAPPPLADNPQLRTLISIISTGLISVATLTAGAIGLIIGACGLAFAICVKTAGAGAPIVIPILVVFILLVAIGWFIMVLIAIASAVVQGILLFSGSSSQPAAIELAPLGAAFA